MIKKYQIIFLFFDLNGNLLYTMNDIVKAKIPRGFDHIEKKNDSILSRYFYYYLHLNSANDILIKKEESWKLLDGDAKKRRQSSERSISVLTNGDLRQKASGGKVAKKRNDRKKLDNRDIEEYELN